MSMNHPTVRPILISDVDGESADSDIIVVGLGCAGAAAALGATEQGSSVTVIEWAGPGGSSALSGGELYLGGGTALQKACGFDDDPGSMEEYLCAALGPDPDREKIHAYCHGSIEHFDWLVSQGVPFKETLWSSPTWVPPTDDGLMWLGENSWPYDRIATPAPRGHRVQSEGFGGKVLMECLTSAVEDAGVEIHEYTRATRLIVGEDGAVKGVLARRYGEDLAFLARKAVIVTAGGFIDNREMVDLGLP
ncbi:FAD-dependent oxidoreductase [Gordonia sp. LSe1-13]|uniref:FAD-dependent oxidoreductase n=1 Tax=Gordonia sesuvii TaxID=3116777 RepID=A0ABU7MA30_9ACTN|nr:FAD-dependent oxidoreductase [Gordonia sp. LSe1-13]